MTNMTHAQRTNARQDKIWDTAMLTTKISHIDQEIDAIRRELRKRERINPLSAASWQRAWDLHPELREGETELFRQRGVAQQERDAKAHKDWMREKRQKRA